MKRSVGNIGHFSTINQSKSVGLFFFHYLDYPKNSATAQYSYSVVAGLGLEHDHSLFFIQRVFFDAKTPKGLSFVRFLALVITLFQVEL